MVDIPNTPASTGSQSRENGTTQDGLIAKQYILLDLGMTEDQVAKINSVGDANALIEYLEKKKAISKPAVDAPKVNAKPSFTGIVPIPPTNNPEPKTNRTIDVADAVPYSVEELFDPLQTDVSRVNHFGQSKEEQDEARILKVYDDRSPEGRLV